MSHYRIQVDASRESVRACTACPLHATRTHAVPWEGEPSPVILIGEAPGADEDQVGRPFVGRSGELLTSLAESAGLFRHTDESSVPTGAIPYAVANTIGCRPPRNDYTLAESVGAPAACRVHLDAALDLSHAWLVVLVGGRALSAFAPHRKLSESVGRLWWGYGDSRLYTVIYHPAYLLRRHDPELESTTVTHLRRIANVAALGINLEAPPFESTVRTVAPMSNALRAESIRKHYDKRGWVAVGSDVLGDQIVIARPDVRVPDKWAGHARYTLDEIARMRGEPEFLRRVHAVKLAFGALVVA